MGEAKDLRWEEEGLIRELEIQDTSSVDTEVELEKIRNESVFHDPRGAKLAYYLLVFLGGSYLFPWNSILNSFPYFIREYSLDSGDPSFIYPFCIFGGSLTMNIILVIFGSRINQKSLIITALSMTILAEGSAPLLAYLNQSESSFIISCILVGLLGVGEAMNMSATLGLAGLFGPKYMNAVTTGMAIAGIFLSAIKAISLLAFTHTEPQEQYEYSALLFFTVTVALLIMAIVCALKLFSLPFSKFYLNLQRTKSVDGTKGRRSGTLLSRIKRIYPQIYDQAICVFIVFFSTFAVFPGAAFAEKCCLSFTSFQWFNVWMAMEVSIFNTVGRYLVAKFMPFKKKTSPIFTFVRLVFTPLILMSAMKSDNVVFGADWFKIVDIGLFALTSGYASGMHLMFGATSVDKKDRKVTGFIMFFYLMSGIFLGTLFDLFYIQTLI